MFHASLVEGLMPSSKRWELSLVPLVLLGLSMSCGGENASGHIPRDNGTAGMAGNGAAGNGTAGMAGNGAAGNGTAGNANGGAAGNAPEPVRVIRGAPGGEFWDLTIRGVG